MPAQELLKQGEKRRKQMLRFITRYIAKNGYSPTIAEIGDAVGVVSPNAVRTHLHKMRDDGIIEITPRVARSIVVKDAPE